jgi:hypothetical protein
MLHVELNKDSRAYVWELGCPDAGDSHESLRGDYDEA